MPKDGLVRVVECIGSNAQDDSYNKPVGLLGFPSPNCHGPHFQSRALTDREANAAGPLLPWTSKGRRAV